jgi:hypothetical protein
MLNIVTELRLCLVYEDHINTITSICTAVKMGLHKYHKTCFSRSGMNQMWILKNSKDLLETLSSRSQYVCNNNIWMISSWLNLLFDFLIAFDKVRCVSTNKMILIPLVSVLLREATLTHNKFNQDEIIQMLDF